MKNSWLRTTLFVLLALVVLFGVGALSFGAGYRMGSMNAFVQRTNFQPPQDQNPPSFHRGFNGGGFPGRDFGPGRMPMRGFTNGFMRLPMRGWMMPGHILGILALGLLGLLIIFLVIKVTRKPEPASASRRGRRAK